jgi:hypothetical protein
VSGKRTVAKSRAGSPRLTSSQSTMCHRPEGASRMLFHQRSQWMMARADPVNARTARRCESTGTNCGPWRPGCGPM